MNPGRSLLLLTVLLFVPLWGYSEEFQDEALQKQLCGVFQKFTTAINQRDEEAYKACLSKKMLEHKKKSMRETKERWKDKNFVKKIMASAEKKTADGSSIRHVKEIMQRQKSSDLLVDFDSAMVYDSLGRLLPLQGSPGNPVLVWERPLSKDKKQYSTEMLWNFYKDRKVFTHLHFVKEDGHWKIDEERIRAGFLTADDDEEKAYQSGNPKVDIAKTDVDLNIPTALKLYQLDNGRYPTTEQGLKALYEKPKTEPSPKNWNGPYVEVEPRDPWGNPYGYKLLTEGDPDGAGVYKLWSNGPKGVMSEYNIIKIEPLLSGEQQHDLVTLDQNRKIIQEKLLSLLSKHTKKVSVELLPHQGFAFVALVNSPSEIFKIQTALMETQLMFFQAESKEIKKDSPLSYEMTLNCKFAEFDRKIRDIKEIDALITQLDKKLTSQEDLEKKRQADIDEARRHNALDTQIITLSARGDDAGVLEKVNEYISSYPDDTFGYVIRARMYLDRKLFKEALADFSRGIEHCGDMCANTWKLRAELLVYMGEYARAIEDYSEQISWNLKNNEAQAEIAWTKVANPIMGDDYIGRGNAYLKAEKYKEALKDLETALNYVKDRDDVVLLRALAYEVLGDQDKVKENIAKLRSLKNDLVECDISRKFGCRKYQITADGHIILKEKLPDAIKPVHKISSVEDRLSKTVNWGSSDLPVQNFLSTLAMDGGFQLKMMGQFNQKLSAHFQQVPLKNVLNAICELTGLHYSISNETLEISPGEEFQEADTRWREKLNNGQTVRINADDMNIADMLTFISDKIKVTMLIDGEVKGKISATNFNGPAGELLQKIKEEHHLEYVNDGAIMMIMTREKYESIYHKK